MPEGVFDLIVASEVLYYLPREVVLEALRRLKGYSRRGRPRRRALAQRDQDLPAARG